MEKFCDIDFSSIFNFIFCYKYNLVISDRQY